MKTNKSTKNGVTAFVLTKYLMTYYVPVGVNEEGEHYYSLKQEVYITFNVNLEFYPWSEIEMLFSTAKMDLETVLEINQLKEFAQKLKSPRI